MTTEETDIPQPETEEQEQPQKSPVKTFTQAEVERMISKRVRTMQTELESRPESDQVKALQDQLEELKQEKELAGKSEIEKIQHQHQRELEKRERALKELSDQAEELRTAVQDRDTRIRQDRLSRAFRDALDKVEVLPSSATDALRVLIEDLKDVEIDDDGKVVASYGPLIDEPPAKIAEAFLKDRPWFAQVKGGGAGTSPPNAGSRGKPGEGAPVDLIAAGLKGRL